MKNDLPDNVTFIEVGPRDGFQFEKQMIPTEMKVEIINDLVEAGLKHIQVASFVNPARVPQMADAEEVVNRLPASQGIRTGVDIAAVSKCSRRLEDYLAKRFPGRMHRLLQLDNLQH